MCAVPDPGGKSRSAQGMCISGHALCFTASVQAEQSTWQLRRAHITCRSPKVDQQMHRCCLPRLLAVLTTGSNMPSMIQLRCQQAERVVGGGSRQGSCCLTAAQSYAVMAVLWSTYRNQRHQGTCPAVKMCNQAVQTRTQQQQRSLLCHAGPASPVQAEEATGH